MLVISLRAILEEVASTGKHYGGDIQGLHNLLEPGKLAKLKESASACCFLAFHPTGDAAVTDYVCGDTLPDDSGPDLLVLFTLAQPAPIAVPVRHGSFDQWAELKFGVHPAYQLVRLLFEGKRPPVLPGLVVFQDLGTDTDGLYLPLSRLDKEVRARLRDVFADISYEARKDKPAKFLDNLGVCLSRRGLAYERTNRRPIREWLLAAFRLTGDHYGDIVGTIGLFK